MGCYLSIFGYVNMIDTSKYPNLLFRTKRTDGLVDEAEFRASKLLPYGVSIEVCPSSDGQSFIIERWLDNNEFGGMTDAYKFPALEQTLEAADKIDGTDESWEAISEFKI